MAGDPRWPEARAGLARTEGPPFAAAPLRTRRGGGFRHRRVGGRERSIRRDAGRIGTPLPGAARDQAGREAGRTHSGRAECARRAANTTGRAEPRALAVDPAPARQSLRFREHSGVPPRARAGRGSRVAHAYRRREGLYAHARVQRSDRGGRGQPAVERPAEHRPRRVPARAAEGSEGVQAPRPSPARGFGADHVQHRTAARSTRPVRRLGALDVAPHGIARDAELERRPIVRRQPFLGRRLEDAVRARLRCPPAGGRGRRRRRALARPRVEPAEGAAHRLGSGGREPVPLRALPQRPPAEGHQADGDRGCDDQQQERLAHAADAATRNARQPVSGPLDAAGVGPHGTGPMASGPSGTADRLLWGLLAIAAGAVAVVDFWATWCAPCRVSMPRIQEVWREYGPRGVDLYSVDTDDPGADREAQVKEFLLRNGLTFPVVLDDGTASSAFSIAVLPTMLVLDRDAHVVWNHVGALTGAGERELRGVLDRALAVPAAARGGG